MSYMRQMPLHATTMRSCAGGKLRRGVEVHGDDDASCGAGALKSGVRKVLGTISGEPVKPSPGPNAGVLLELLW